MTAAERKGFTSVFWADLNESLRDPVYRAAYASALDEAALFADDERIFNPEMSAHEDIAYRIRARAAAIRRATS